MAGGRKAVPVPAYNTRVRFAFFTTRMLLGYGVDLTIHELARRLVEQYGHEVDVYTPTSDATYATAPYRIRELIVYGAPVNRALCMLELNAAIALRGLHRRLRAEGTRYDAVIPCTHPYYCAGAVLRRPQLFFNFGNAPLHAASLKTRLNWQWLEASEALWKPRSACVASISRFLHAQQRAGVQRRGRVLHLGGDHYGQADPNDTETRTQRRTAARTALGLPPDGVLAGFCGRLHKRHTAYKGTAQVLALARWLAGQERGAQVALCGLGSPDDAAWVREHGALPLANLPPEKMPLFYDALDLYVCASTWEGFNLPIVEAAWHGLPSVAYAAGAHGEHTTSVLVPSGELLALQQATLRLVRDGAERERRGREAWARAQQFSWDRCAVQFEALLREVAR
jgi:glycosyltransferase involved in cell wall biosynthesis